MFDFNVYKFVLWLIPVYLRKAAHWAWLKSLHAPVAWLHTRFDINRKANIYKLGITPQVVYMEKALNDRFDLTLRRIVIIDVAYATPIFFYQEAENNDVYLYQEIEGNDVYIYQPGEYEDQGFDFVVQYPAILALTASELNEMKAMVNFYKMVSKTYYLEAV